ncbi:MAG: DUF2092 domain-containing protein [Acetobacteraceae bacterium]
MKRLVIIMLACLLTVGADRSVVAQVPPSAPAVTAPEEQADAMTILKRMTDTLATATSFSVTLNATYDVVQGSGEKVEFGEVRQILLSRPNDLRINVEGRDGTRQEIRFNGNALTMITPGTPFYAALEHPGSVDDILFYIAYQLQTPIPLSLLLVTTVTQELEKRIQEIDLVDNETLGGKEVDHLAARTEEVDFQVWVAKGAPAVPLRVVISYKKAPGQPQFAANLSDWNFAPKIDTSAFTFLPPGDARPIPFMVRVTAKPKTPGAGR